MKKIKFKGLGPEDNIIILCIAFLQRGRVHFLTNLLARYAIIEWNGLMYRLADVESFDLFTPEFESFMEDWFKPKAGEVFLDIGAHIGRYTIPTSRAVGVNGLIVAFEPASSNFERLVENLRLNKIQNVIPMNLAAWNKDAEVALNLGGSASTHSLVYSGQHGVLKVKGRSIDNVVHELNLSRVDWAKVDVEGAECQALEGLKETMRRFAPTIIVEVFSEHETWLKEFMHSHDYDTRVIWSLPSNGYVKYFYCSRRKTAP